MKNSIETILLTGAAGFIGAHLTRRLVKKGYKIRIVELKDVNTWRIKDLIDVVVRYDVDLRKTDEVLRVIRGLRPDDIFHLATYYAVEHKPEEIRLMVDTNVLGVVNLLEGVKEVGVKLFVNTSSCFVYAENTEKMKEDSGLKPLNLYALTKMQAEQACTFYTEKYGFKAVTFRLFPPYGPADHEGRLIPYVIRNFYEGKQLKLTTGMQKWDFTYIDDIVEAYISLLNNLNLAGGHEIFNIGAGRAVSIREVILQIKELMGVKYEPEWGAIPHRENEVWFICADASKAKELIRWKPHTGIEKELEITVNWYKEFLIPTKREYGSKN